MLLFTGCRTVTPIELQRPDTACRFQDRAIFDDKVPLDPVAFYVNAIEAVASWSATAWDSSVVGIQGVSVPGFDITVTYLDTIPQRSENPLLMSYILSGLYQGVSAMVHENSFRELVAQLNFLGKTKGVLGIAPYSLQVNPLELDPNSSLLAPPGNRESVIVSGESGEIVDPKYTDLRTRWKITGPSVATQDVLSSILDVTVNAAPEMLFLGQGYIIGCSFSGRYALNFRAVGSPHHVRWRSTSALLQDALRMLTKELFFQKSGCAEMEVLMVFQSHEIARGSLSQVARGFASDRIMGIRSP